MCDWPLNQSVSRLNRNITWYWCGPLCVAGYCQRRLVPKNSAEPEKEQTRYYNHHPKRSTTPPFANTGIQYSIIQHNILQAPGVQMAILPNYVQWSALFLLPGSNYLEPTPCFCPSFNLCHFFQLFQSHYSEIQNQQTRELISAQST